MSKTYFYFVSNELGEAIAEFVSGELPPAEGAIMNLRPITSKYGKVEVVKVEQSPLPGYTVVKVTVKPVA